MMRDIFNGQARNKPATFELTPAVPEGADIIRRLTALGDLRNDIRNWVLEQTGCLPDVMVDNERNAVSIHCTGAFMSKVEEAFSSRIASIERIRPFDEIPPDERGCFNPRSPRL